jgi:DNA repair protein RecO (recombination protein O)
VLRGRSLGEADRILTFFTLEHGKVEAVAKGVRRGRSKLGGRLEFGNEVALELHRGRSLDVIGSVEILTEHWRALVEPTRFAAASAACEMVDAFCEPDLALPDVYALLLGVLSAIAASSKPDALLSRFYMRLLDSLGLAPPLEACVRCGHEFSVAHVWLDAEAGGFIDDACRERWRDLPELTHSDMRNLRGVAAPRGQDATLIARRRVAKAVALLIAHHLGRQPKTSATARELEMR